MYREGSLNLSIQIMKRKKSSNDDWKDYFQIDNDVYLYKSILKFKKLTKFKDKI